MTRLVRLRTAPMPDPGEWCEIDLDQCPHLDEWGQCDLGYTISDHVGGTRRPQSCIDAAEEVET